MNFYFDESGSFVVPEDPTQHSVGIVSGVVSPESDEPAIFQAINSFISTLPPTAFQNGEPKGRLFNDNNLARLADLITELPLGILFCPIVIDLTSLQGKSTAQISSEVSGSLAELAPSCTDPGFQIQVRNFADMVGKMSNQQMLRLYAWARCIRRSVEESLFWHSFSRFQNDWSVLRFEIDPVQASGGTEAEVFDFMLRQWIVGWCRQQPMVIPNDTLTPSHPFMRKWNTPNGIDAKKMFDRNIHYVSSAKSTGIQLADMTATLIPRAILNRSESNLYNYGMLMTRTLGDPQRAAGISFFGTPEERLTAEARYDGLGEVICFARKHIPTAYAIPSLAKST